MASRPIQPTRIQTLNDRAPRRGDYVLYWMQQSQRTEDNHALEYAVQQANALGLPLCVVFGLMDDYPEANLRHYAFLVEGLQDVEQGLERRGIRFVVRRGQPAEVALDASRQAALTVCDRGYLRHQKHWRRRLAQEADCPVVQVESDVVVPVAVASPKAEYAARTLRPKLHRHLGDYLIALDPTPLDKDSLNLPADGLDLSDPQALLDSLKLDRSVAPVSELFKGGTREAKRLFGRFLASVDRYAEHRNQPQTDAVSQMSKYLHFGQVSPLWLALAMQNCPDQGDRDKDVFIEELIVRRELAMNFVEHTEHYDSYRSLPDWARKTLEAHRDDPREHRYTRRQLEDADTHDPYWNAAMREMRHTGYMHNYMRMYWGKKILEWCDTPQYAFETALYLNNRYFLDGRDPNSYAGVGWVFGLHDRPWRERAVFGTVRYMSAGGLERKCDIDGYVTKVDRLVARLDA